MGQDHSDYSAHTRGRLAHFVLHIPMFISNRAFLSDAYFALINASFIPFFAPEPVRHSIQIRDLLMFAICLRTLELLKTAEGVVDHHEQTIALLWVSRWLTLTTPVSTARTICSSDVSEAPGVVC